jgi:hypothetical protein
MATASRGGDGGDKSPSPEAHNIASGNDDVTRHMRRFTQHSSSSSERPGSLSSSERSSSSSTRYESFPPSPYRRSLDLSQPPGRDSSPAESNGEHGSSGKRDSQARIAQDERVNRFARRSSSGSKRTDSSTGRYENRPPERASSSSPSSRYESLSPDPSRESLDQPQPSRRSPSADSREEVRSTYSSDASTSGDEGPSLQELQAFVEKVNRDIRSKKEKRESFSSDPYERNPDQPQPSRRSPSADSSRGEVRSAYASDASTSTSGDEGPSLQELQAFVEKVNRDIRSKKSNIEYDEKFENYEQYALARRENIERLINDLPQSMPRVTDLDARRMYRLYIDEDYRSKAEQEHPTNPGKVFDGFEPGYQRGVTDAIDHYLKDPTKQVRFSYDTFRGLRETLSRYSDERRQRNIRMDNGVFRGQTGEVRPTGAYPLYRRDDSTATLQEHEAALAEMQNDHVQGVPLCTRNAELKSEDDVRNRFAQVYDPRQAITISVPDGADPYRTLMIPNYPRSDNKALTDAIFQEHYDKQAQGNQTKYERLTEIVKTWRRKQVAHTSVDGNGRSNITIGLNKMLIDEGFCPTILPESPRVFGGAKTLDGLVEDVVVGMHRFIAEVKAHPAQRVEAGLPAIES